MAVTAVWKSLLLLFLELDGFDGKSVGILMVDEEEDEDGSERPGKSCLRGALDDMMMMLYVMSIAEQVITNVKNSFPQPMAGGDEAAVGVAVAGVKRSTGGK